MLNGPTTSSPHEKWLLDVSLSLRTFQADANVRFMPRDTLLQEYIPTKVTDSFNELPENRKVRIVAFAAKRVLSEEKAGLDWPYLSPIPSKWDHRVQESVCVTLRWTHFVHRFKCVANILANQTVSKRIVFLPSTRIVLWDRGSFQFLPRPEQAAPPLDRATRMAQRLRRSLCGSTATPLLLLAYVLLVANVVNARMAPPSFSHELHDKWKLTWFHHHEQTRLNETLAACIREGRFPKAGRSLEDKIHEAKAFLERELGNPEIAGVGSSVAIVYQDQVVLSQGYGLRQVNDTSSTVTTSTLFQIGSVTKTFITLGIATLVDEGKVAWKDPVIKHLPTLQLFDKYAEKYVTIGDLLSMNSGLGETMDLGLVFGHYPTDDDLVQALRYVVPPHSLRSEYEYSNTNFAILGQLIRHVTGLEWDAFLKQRIWEPLGMTRTFASAWDVRNDNDTSDGHFSCGGDVVGPLSLVHSPKAQLVTGEHGGKIAAGSVVSSSDDMATLMRLLLNKGSVNGVSIVQKPKLITEMVSGKCPVNAEFQEMLSKGGHHFVAEGNTLAVGYGFDFVGHALWGHAYYDKSGDTTTHQTRTGFIPDQKLGVIVMANSQLPSPHGNYIMDHIRSYVLGVFLDVPKELLDFSYSAWRTQDQLVSPAPGVPVCGLYFWRDPPSLQLEPDVRGALVGTYLSQESPEFYRSVEIVENNDTKQLELHAGLLSGPLQLVFSAGDNDMIFLWTTQSGPNLGEIRKSVSGKYEIDMGILFRQQ